MTKRYTRFETQAAMTTNDSSWTPAGTAHILDVSGEDINVDNGYIYPTTQSNRTYTRGVKGPVKIAGPIDTPLFPKSAASLLYYGLGSCTTSGSSAPFTHALKKGDSIPQFSCEVGKDVKAHKFVGGIVNSISIDYAPDDTLNASFDCVFRKELATSALATVTFPDFDSADRAFAGHECAFKLGAAEGGSPSASTICEAFSVSIENNVSDDAFALGDRYLPANIVAQLGITGTMDVRYDASTQYDDFLATTEKEVHLVADNGGSSAASRKITLKLPRIAYDTNRLPTDNVERFVQAISWTAEPNAAGDPILVDVVNAEANAAFVA